MLNSTIEEISGFRASTHQLEKYVSRNLGIQTKPDSEIIKQPIQIRKQQTDEDVSFWIIPATYRDSISRLVAQEKMWAFGENTGGKSSLKVDDHVCFYLSSKGIVAHGKAASEPRFEHDEKVRDPEKYPWVFKLKEEEVYLDSPVVLDKEKRSKLDAFRGKEKASNWGWFVMGSHRITQKDYYELIRTN